KKGHDLAASAFEPRVAGRRHAPVWLPEISDRGVERQKRLARAVTRAVVDHDQLEVSEPLCTRARDRAADEVATLERRHDHRDNRRSHSVPRHPWNPTRAP